MTHLKPLIFASIFAVLSLGSAFAQSRGSGIVTNVEQINALDYRLQKHKPYVKFPRSKFSDNTFYSVFAGTELAISGHNVRANFGSRLGASFGKWFTPISGLRLSLSMGSLPVYDNWEKFIQQNNGIDIDYLVNLSSIGLNKDDVFRRHEILGILGLSYRLGILNDKYHQIGGFGLGLQYKFHVTESMSFFAEPRLSFYTDNVDNHENVRGYNPLLSLQVGASYRMLPLELRKNTEPINNSIFANNSFISAGIGFQRVNSTAVSALPILRQYGPTLFFGYGKWFSGVSGARVGASFATSWIGERNNQLSIGLKAEYLLNMNALVAGYNPKRKFELYALGGIVSSSFFDNTKVTFLPGLGMGVQANFNVSPTENIYIEPRYDLYLENSSTRTTTTHYTNGVFSLVAGVNFKAIPDAPRRESLGSFYRRRGIGNRSLSVAGGGVNYMDMRYALSPKFNRIGYGFDIAFSERFAPYSELRIGVGLQWPKTLDGKQFLSGNLHVDHLWDMTSYIYGYNYDRRFSMLLVSGINLALTDNEGTNIAPGIGVGLQARYQVARGVSFFLEPRFNIYTDNYVKSQSSQKGYDATSMLMIGASIGPQYETGHEWLKEKEKVRELEYIVALGPSLLVPQTSKKVDGELIGLVGDVGVEYHLNPSSSFRGLIGAGGSTLSKDNRYFFATLRADYLFNITNFFLGYQPQRIFNLSAVLGASFGTTLNDRLIGNSIGGGVGLQGQFRLTENTRLFIEPRFDVYGKDYLKNWVSGSTDMVASVLAGVAMKSKYVAERPTVNHRLPQRNMEYFLGGGPELFGTYQAWTNPGKYIGGNGFVGAQWNFTALSALRGTLTLGSSKVPYNKTHSQLSLGVDYLFNFSNFFRGYNPNRIFSVYGVAGLNAAGIKEESSKGIGVGVGIGLQGKVRIVDGFNLFVEPHQNVYVTQPIGKVSSIGKTSIMTSVMVGASFSPQFSTNFPILPKLEQSKRFFDGLDYQLGIGAIAMYSNPSLGFFPSMGPFLSFGASKSITHASAFRLSGRVGVAQHNARDRFTNASLHLDYLLNLSNIFTGYNPGRIFSLSALVGASGAITYSNFTWQAAPGVGAGLHADFALTDRLSIYVEPRTDIYTSHYVSGSRSSTKPNMLASLEAGIKFRTEKSTKKLDNSNWNRLNSMTPGERMFVFVSAGPAICINDATLNKGLSSVGYGIQAGIGYQLTPFSQVQASYSTIKTPVLFKRTTPISTSFNGLKLDYKLQLVPMVLGFDPNRLVNVDVILGIDGGNSNCMNKNAFVFGGHVGGELSFNVSNHLTISATPTLSLFTSKWNQTNDNSKGSLVGDVKFGVSYHF